MMTITPASAMARGSPARIVRPTPRPGPRSSAAGRRCCGSASSRSTLSSCTGTQLMPATSPKWATWADMAPAKANESAPRKPARLRQAEGPQEAEHAKPGHRPGDDHAERPRRDGRQDGEQERERVRGARRSSRRAAARRPRCTGCTAAAARCGSRCPASTRSGKFWVRSSPGRTACPSSAGIPKTMTGSARRTATATASPVRRAGACRVGTGNAAGAGAGDSSDLITRTLATKPEGKLGIPSPARPDHPGRPPSHT